MDKKFNSISSKDLLRFEIKPFLFGVLFSRIMVKPVSASQTPEYFYIYTRFMTSKAVFRADFAFKDYAKKLTMQYNRVSGYENWEIYSASDTVIELRLYIKNDLNVSLDTFKSLVYKSLIKSDWLYETGLTEGKKFFVRGFMESRGTVDIKANFIAQDYFYSNAEELKRLQVLTDRILPMEYANFNPRNLQPQYVSGECKRNDQFRINKLYYAKEIGFINEYKAQVFENSYPASKDKVSKNNIIYFSVPSLDLESDIRSDLKFIKTLFFVANNIQGKELTATMVAALRKELGFTCKGQSLSAKRDISLIKIFSKMTEDKCALCDTVTTFTKTDGTQDFEIHHFIPFHNGVKYDNIANFVKLCSNCHNSFKKGRASRATQIRNLIKIMHKHPGVFEYAKAVLGKEDIIQLAEFIQQIL